MSHTNKADLVLGNVANALNLRGASMPGVLGGLIQPSVDLQRYIDELSLEQSSADYGSTGFKTVLTIPQGERWDLHVLYAIQTVGASGAYNAFAINDGASRLVFYLPASAANELVYALPQPIPLAAGWSLEIRISTYNASDVLQATACVSKSSQLTPPSL